LINSWKTKAVINRPVLLVTLAVVALLLCGAYNRQEIGANAHETRDSISLISYEGCLGLSPVYFSKNSL